MAPLLVVAAALAGPGGPGDRAPDRDWDITHLHLDLSVEPDARAVHGTATLTVAPLLPPSTTLTLDHRGLDFTEVRVNGEPATFQVQDETVTIEVGAVGAPATVAVDYSAHPMHGLHFRGDGPDTYTEVWSQGEGTDNRAWFPTYDAPGDRFTYSGRFVVPDGMTAVSNGLGTFDGTAWTYRLDHELVSYLVMLAVAPYQVHRSTWRDREVLRYLPPDVRVDALADPSGQVPEILEFFSELTGVEYPYPSYTEVFVQRFLYAGMENTTATVEARELLTPAREAGATWWPENVFAHEAAHQWYGDLLTCRTWHELWLNEGFAQFMAGWWMRDRYGEAWWQAMLVRSHASARNAGPLAGRWWSTDEGDAVNSAVYTRGASVLQMLRTMYGDEAFWTAIRAYTRDHVDTLVATEDLRRSFEQVTGDDLAWFFDQWAHLPGSPTVAVTPRWADGELTIAVRQSGERTWVFPLDVEIGTDDGPVLHRIFVDQASVRATVPLQAAPAWVAVDPEHGVLATFEVDQSQAQWIAQLGSTLPGARLAALTALAEGGAADPVIEALTAVAADPDPILRAAAAKALGDLRSTEAHAALRALLADDPAPSVREAAATALGHGVSAAPIVRALRAAAQSDPWRGTRTAALGALARQDREAALSLARAWLDRPAAATGHLHAAAAAVVGEHGTAADLSRLILAMRDRNPRDARHAAGNAAARLVAREESEGTRRAAAARVARAAEVMLDDADQTTRRTGVALLALVGDAQSAEALEAYRRAELVPALGKAAKDAARRIRRRGDLPEPETASVAARLEELEHELERVSGELEALSERR